MKDITEFLWCPCLQDCMLTLFDLQLQRRFVHSVEHEDEIIPWQPVGIGYCVIRNGWSLLSSTFFNPNVSECGRRGSDQLAFFQTIALQWRRFTCSDKASLVCGSASGFPFFENKIALASSTDLTLSNLYILQTNSTTSSIFFSVSSPFYSGERSVWSQWGDFRRWPWCWNTFALRLFQTSCTD